MADGEPLSTRCEMPGQPLPPDVFGPCATAGARLAATANTRAAVATDRVSFRTSFKLMRAQVRAGRPSGVRRGSADLSRHADRDRRATPFIPACATVNSVCGVVYVKFSKLVMSSVRWRVFRSIAVSLCSIGNDHPFVPTCLLAERRAQRQSRMSPRRRRHRRSRRAASLTERARC
jgi:hypothetical protein